MLNKRRNKSCSGEAANRFAGQAGARLGSVSRQGSREEEEEEEEEQVHRLRRQTKPRGSRASSVVVQWSHVSQGEEEGVGAGGLQEVQGQDRVSQEAGRCHR